MMKRALLRKCLALVVLLLMPTLMVAQDDVMDVDSIGKDSLDVTPTMFQDVVNPLVKWLMKR